MAFDPTRSPGQKGWWIRLCGDRLHSHPSFPNSLLKCWSHCHLSLKEANALVSISNQSELDNNINPSRGWQEKAPPRFKCLDKKFALIRAEVQEMSPCRAAGTARDRALLRLKCSCLLQERPGCNWDWAMGGGREEVTKRESFRSPRTAQRQLSSINPNSVSKYATGQLAPHAPENEEPCGKHQAMDLRRGKGRVKSCPVLRLRSGTHRSGRRV